MNHCDVGGRLDARTGNGVDSVDLRNAPVSSMYVNLGLGADEFLLLNSRIQTTTNIRGGGHSDEGIQADKLFGRNPIFSSFESGNMPN